MKERTLAKMTAQFGREPVYTEAIGPAVAAVWERPFPKFLLFVTGGKAAAYIGEFDTLEQAKEKILSLHEDTKTPEFQKTFEEVKKMLGEEN